MPEDPQKLEFGSDEYIAHWGCVTRYQLTAQYMDGFGAYPDKSSNDCPHSEGLVDPDLPLRRRWMQGYIDATTLAGVVGNPSEETLAALFKALPTDLKDIVANWQHPAVEHLPLSTAVEPAENESFGDGGKKFHMDPVEPAENEDLGDGNAGTGPMPDQFIHEPVVRFIHNAIATLKEAMDSDAARAAGFDQSHKRAWGLLADLEAETALWKDK